MIPVYLDPAHVKIGLVGRGDIAARRLDWLRAAGARPMIWSDRPEPGLMAAAGAGLIAHLPQIGDLHGISALWIADLARAEAEPLVRLARASHTLVNVEDVPSLCDFHSPAVVRRGRLTLTAGTGGASPAVARVVRERLEAQFSPAWGRALDEITHSRQRLREQGAGFPELNADAENRLALHGLI